MHLTTTNRFFYQPSSVVKAPLLSLGLQSTYGGGGYVKNLGLSIEEAAPIISNLMDNIWTDRGTRVVFLDFTLYNANINLFCQIRNASRICSLLLCCC